MRNLFACLLIALFSFGLVIEEASAKRFGSGRSFGVQRSKSSLSTPYSPQYNKTMGQRPQQTNRWGSMLGGLLIGGLLASLFMGHGIGTGILSWLILGLVVFFIVSFFRRRMQPSYQSTHSNHSYGQASSNNYRNNYSPSQSSGYGSAGHSSGFDSENFLQDAKTKFVRLQKAYDQKNLQELHNLTAPEVFAEIKMQLDERGDIPNKTEVLHLNAELLDVSRQADSTIASVRFAGTIKENDEITQLNEIWHFRQFFHSNEWVVGGIQQEIIDPS